VVHKQASVDVISVRRAAMALVEKITPLQTLR
jgi:hypothetical protein